MGLCTGTVLIVSIPLVGWGFSLWLKLQSPETRTEIRGK